MNTDVLTWLDKYQHHLKELVLSDSDVDINCPLSSYKLPKTHLTKVARKYKLKITKKMIVKNIVETMYNYRPF